MAAWVRSDALSDALADAPCGCELAAEGSRETDPAARRGALDLSRRRCAAWRCPRAGHEPARSELAGPEREALDRVARLTGYRAETCPLEAAYRVEVARACRAKRYQLSASIEPDPPALLVDAVAAVERGEGELLDHLHRARESSRAASHEIQGPVSDPERLPRPRLHRTR